MNFDCPYCQKPARWFHDSFTKSYSWQCDYHGSVRVRKCPVSDTATLSPTDKYTVTLVVLYKEELYHCIFNYNFTIGPKFQILKVRRWPKTHQIVLSMDFHPDITPENIEAKLPTLILFS